MIKLTVPFEEKDQAKQLGAFWNKEEKFWYIPDNVDYQPFSKWIDDETWKQLTRAIECSISSIFNHITNQIDVPFTRYDIEADVYNEYIIPNSQNRLLELIDDHNPNRTLTAIVPVASAENITFKDKRIRLVGTLDLYKPYGRFQLKVEDFIILGDCSRIQKIQQWENENASILDKESANRKFNFNFSDNLIIGVITAKNAAGFNDFHTKLSRRYILNDDEQFIRREIELTAPTIIEALGDLQQQKCNVICLIRGGGEAEKLLPFSEPALLKALYESNVPIVIGVGHASDKLLCKQVKGVHNADTPTGAAEYLNKLAKNYFDEKTKAENIKKRQAKDKVISAELQSAMNEIDKLTEENEQLTQHNYQLQQTRSQLIGQLENAQNEINYLRLELQKASQQKKTFLSRFFG